MQCRAALSRHHTHAFRYGFLVTLMILSVSVAAPSQAAPVRWGVRGGISASTLGGEFGDVAKNQAKVGLDMGVTFQLPLADGFALQSGASYVNKGAKSRGEATDPFGNPIGTFESTWKVDYVEVPVLLRIELAREARLRPYVEAGPSLGILLDGTFNPGIGLFPSFNLKNDLNALDAGYAVGAGATVPFQSGRFGVGVRYTSGFSDAFNIDGNPGALNRVWSITVGWSQ